jgi:WD40 repeat protein
VYSIDFHPTSNRFATAGADKTVKVRSTHVHNCSDIVLKPLYFSHTQIWRWTVDGEIALEFVSTLQRHNSAVNIVRFSPNGKPSFSAALITKILLTEPFSIFFNFAVRR